jgi:hypothetical protein
MHVKSGVVGTKGMWNMIVCKSMIKTYENICVGVDWNVSVSGWRLSGWSTDKVEEETEHLVKNKLYLII